MTAIFARLALLDSGWRKNVRLQIAAGRISAVARDTVAADGDHAAGIVIPGMSNAHSHAFQRALAGHTEQRAPRGQEDFWSWRGRMYALARRVDAAALYDIARQAYSEMLSTGFTSVAEFHYLHNEPGEQKPTDRMFDAIAAAAGDTGIRLTYVPVLYERAGFDDAPLSDDQQRFARTLDEFAAHHATVSSRRSDAFHTAIGVHSLRAVTPASLSAVAELAVKAAVPMHIHIAEQQREVEECVAALGARPVQWLLDNAELDARWCLVHATHIDDAEVTALSRSGAVVCLCPSTEANLGDGIFPLLPYLEQGGRIAIGSDSHVSINPFEELRWLEYGQRLLSQRRNVATVGRAQTGRNLFERAAEGGGLALGHASGSVKVGADADLVLLDDDSPMLAGHTTRSLIDALVFSGFTLPIDRVMVNGEWQVEEGSHRHDAEIRKAFVRTARKLHSAGKVR